MAAIHKELEDEHAQGEGIMLGLAHDAADGLAVKLWRSIFQLANRAGMIQGAVPMHLLYLEGIRIDQADQG